MRKAIRERRYRVSGHANEEMSEDSLVADDIELIILTSRISKRLTRDPRGTRYEVRGQAADGREAGVVCRFLPSGVLLIVTAYAGEE
jgi:hypothetical protein